MRLNRWALRAWQAERKLTGQELARRAGLKSAGHLSELANGNKQPSWRTVCALAEAMFIDPEVLVGPGIDPAPEVWPHEQGRRHDLIAKANAAAVA